MEGCLPLSSKESCEGRRPSQAGQPNVWDLLLRSALLTQTREEDFPSVSKKVRSELVAYSDWKKKKGGGECRGVGRGHWTSPKRLVFCKSLPECKFFSEVTCRKKQDLSLQERAKSCLGHNLQITLFKTLICDIKDCKTLKMTLLKAHFILMHSVPF